MFRQQEKPESATTGPPAEKTCRSALRASGKGVSALCSAFSPCLRWRAGFPVRSLHSTAAFSKARSASGVGALAFKHLPERFPSGVEAAIGAVVCTQDEVPGQIANRGIGVLKGRSRSLNGSCWPVPVSASVVMPGKNYLHCLVRSARSLAVGVRVSGRGRGRVEATVLVDFKKLMRGALAARCGWPWCRAISLAVHARGITCNLDARVTRRRGGVRTVTLRSIRVRHQQEPASLTAARG